MFKNFIEETCSGTGDTITVLDNTPGRIRFEDAYTTNDPVFYVIEDANGTTKCGGLGVYNGDVANTITRNDTWTWDGATYNESPVSNITLSGGTHTIRVAPLASLLNTWQLKNAWSDLVDSNIIPESDVTKSLGTNILRFFSGYFYNLFSDTVIPGVVKARPLLSNGNFTTTNNTTAVLYNGNPITIPLDTNAYSTSDLSLSSNEIEINRALGPTKITANFSARNTSVTTSDRYTVRWFLEKYNGSTWSTVSGSEVYSYHRNTEDQNGSAAFAVIVQDLGSTYTKLRARCETASVPVTIGSTNDPQGDLVINSAGVSLCLEEINATGIGRNWTTTALNKSTVAPGATPIEAYVEVYADGSFRTGAYNSPDPLQKWSHNYVNSREEFGNNYEIKFTGNATASGGKVVDTWYPLDATFKLNNYSNVSNINSSATGTISIRVKDASETEVTRNYTLTINNVFGG